MGCKRSTICDTRLKCKAKIPKKLKDIKSNMGNEKIN